MKDESKESEEPELETEPVEPMSDETLKEHLETLLRTVEALLSIPMEPRAAGLFLYTVASLTAKLNTDDASAFFYFMQRIMHLYSRLPEKGKQAFSGEFGGDFIKAFRSKEGFAHILRIFTGLSISFLMMKGYEITEYDQLPRVAFRAYSDMKLPEWRSISMEMRTHWVPFAEAMGEDLEKYQRKDSAVKDLLVKIKEADADQSVALETYVIDLGIEALSTISEEVDWSAGTMIPATSELVTCFAFFSSENHLMPKTYKYFPQLHQMVSGLFVEYEEGWKARWW
jgi:hypothetical protein